MAVLMVLESFFTIFIFGSNTDFVELIRESEIACSE